MCERAKEEVEAVEAILMDDMEVVYDERGFPGKLKTVVFPSTAHDTNKQYVCVTLEVTLPSNYPECEPVVHLKNPRGLDDATVDDILVALKDKCSEYLGQPVIFELIELIREKLTESNLPNCHCAVCLYGFCSGDSFTKTKCYHYFHSYCLALHLITTERHFKEEQEKLPMWQKQKTAFQAICPVCREPICCDLKDLDTKHPPQELESAQQFQITTEMRKLQAQMKDLYMYQKSRGGIIDVDAEENKLLLRTNANSDTFQGNNFAGPSLSHVPLNGESQKENRAIHRHHKRNEEGTDASADMSS